MNSQILQTSYYFNELRRKECYVLLRRTLSFCNRSDTYLTTRTIIQRVKYESTFSLQTSEPSHFLL